MKPFEDYIIGADSLLHESEDLFTLIEAHENRSLKLYVYNTTEDSCREVTITPQSSWGGEGSLGCGIGYGYLHRIPIRTGPLDAPKESITKEPPKSSTPSPAQPSWASNLQQPTVSLTQPAITTAQITTSPSVLSPSPQPSHVTSTPVTFNQTTPTFTPASTIPPPSSTFSPQFSSPPLTTSPFPPISQPPPTGLQSSPINPYSMSSVSQSLPHGSYNWNQSPHPANLGGATTVQSSNYPPRSGVPTVGVSSGVLPSMSTTATTIATTSKSFYMVLHFHKMYLN